VNELCSAKPRPEGCLVSALPRDNFCRYCRALIDEKPVTRRRVDVRELRRWKRLGRRALAKFGEAEPSSQAGNLGAHDVVEHEDGET
jgi:hypothetical protein